MQLSKLQEKAYETLKKNNLPIFKTKDLMLLLSIDKEKAYNLLKSLKKKKAINTAKAGLYSLHGINELAIGPYLNWPSYLSFWSALIYYGFTDQMPRDLFYASTRYKKRIKGYKYITISKKRFFGYTKIGDIIIAEKEKAIIDSLLFPKYSGGIGELAACIKRSLEELDHEKLLDYAFKVKSKSVLRRLGFILDTIGYKKQILDKLLKNIGKGYGLLDPSQGKRNNLNKKWLLDINYDIAGRAQ
ncbi:MAG: hypothetical protein KJ561_04325 [Nanoarchaeota archaeon]|nr:hypothetical protein [Nanoarchaeota archaeon]